MMKLGYNEATAMKKSDLFTDLALTEKYNYDYIEIRFDMLNRYLQSHHLDELVDFFKKNTIRPYALNAIVNVNFCNDKEWSAIMAQLEWACKIAQQIGNPYIVVVPTVGDKVAGYSAKEKMEDSVKALNRLADISEKYNVKLAFEPIGFKNCAVNNIRQCNEIIEKVNRDSVGIVIDAFNIYLFQALDDLKDLEAVNVDKIFVFHIDDCENLPLTQLNHCNRLWPGDGVIPLKQLIKVLRQKGFDKIASLELFRPEYWELEPETVIKMGKEKIATMLRIS
jgi:2-keto-myo-inositol isomerase